MILPEVVNDELKCTCGRMDFTLHARTNEKTRGEAMGKLRKIKFKEQGDELLNCFSRCVACGKEYKILVPTTAK